MNLLEGRIGRRVLFGTLYFAEGAPIGLIWWTLPVFLRRAEWTKAEIGALTGLLVLPWALKFVWAPLVDVLRSTRFGFRAWIVMCQIAMCLTLLPLLWIDLRTVGTGWLTAILLTHAIAAATQDVAIDGLAVRRVAPDDRGAISGWMQCGMLAGRGIFGGALLAFVGTSDLQFVVVCLLATIAGVLPIHLCYSERTRADQSPGASGPERDADPATTEAVPRLAAFGAALAAAARQPQTWVVLTFAATAGVTFEMVGTLAGPWMVDLGLGDEAIGQFFGVYAVLGLGLGALIGGKLADRGGRRRVLAGSVLALAALAGTLASLDAESVWLARATLTTLYFAGGAFTAASYALFMDATDPRLGATQLSAFMGATNACESWSAHLAGRLATQHGTEFSFLVAATLGIVALPVARFVRPAPAAQPGSHDSDAPH